MGFRDFLICELFIVNLDEHVNFIIAYKDIVWVMNKNKINSYKKIILDKIMSGHPYKDRMKNHSFSNFEEYIYDNLKDVLVADYDKNKKEITLPNALNSPTTNPLLKKVVKELGIEKINYTAGHYDSIVFGKKDLLGDYPEIFYHGTLYEYLPKIKKYGLVPSFDSGIKGLSSKVPQRHKKQLTDKVYLSVSIQEAKLYAEGIADSADYLGVKLKSYTPMVIELKVPDKAKLVPDYDVDSGASKSTYKHSNATKNSAMTFSGSSEKSGKYVGLIAYHGRIPSNFIQKIIVLHNKSWSQID